MDLLRQPVIGPFLRWRHARRVLQTLLLAVAAAVVLHGLFGSPIAPRNLATVLTSIHWRGLLVVALLAVGNLFCTACPMILVRDAGRRVVSPARRWPSRLRRKWIAVALLIAVLFSYELFDLWELPRATAWLVLAYFGLALLIDLTFTGASFCKYVCPIGQFNFIASTLSPTEVQIRNAGTCGTCQTTDCISGRYAAEVPARLVQRGCELDLFLPMKVGNLDCTLCLDCVQACPHDNIAVTTRLPGIEWLATSHRSGVGRVAQRLDLALLALVFTFAAPLNAFAMTAPAHAVEQWFARQFRIQAEAPALGLLFFLGLVALPAVLLGAAAQGTRWLAGGDGTLRKVAVAFTYALVPLGFGAWLAHYGFHLLTGLFTVVPVAQSAAIDLFGDAVLGEPAWRWTGLRPGTVFPIQLGLVMLGAFGSLALVRATAERDHPRAPGRAALPWIVVVVALAAVAMWVFAQPMDMRGMSTTG